MKKDYSKLWVLFKSMCMHIRRGICHCILDEEKICGRAAVAGGG